MSVAEVIPLFARVNLNLNDPVLPNNKIRPSSQERYPARPQPKESFIQERYPSRPKPVRSLSHGRSISLTFPTCDCECHFQLVKNGQSKRKPQACNPERKLGTLNRPKRVCKPPTKNECPNLLQNVSRQISKPTLESRTLKQNKFHVSKPSSVVKQQTSGTGLSCRPTWRYCSKVSGYSNVNIRPTEISERQSLSLVCPCQVPRNSLGRHRLCRSTPAINENKLFVTNDFEKGQVFKHGSQRQYHVHYCVKHRRNVNGESPRHIIHYHRCTQANTADGRPKCIYSDKGGACCSFASNLIDNSVLNMPERGRAPKGGTFSQYPLPAPRAHSLDNPRRRDKRLQKMSSTTDIFINNPLRKALGDQAKWSRHKSLPRINESGEMFLGQSKPAEKSKVERTRTVERKTFMKNGKWYEETVETLIEEDDGKITKRVKTHTTELDDSFDDTFSCISNLDKINEKKGKENRFQFPRRFNFTKNIPVIGNIPQKSGKSKDTESNSETVKANRNSEFDIDEFVDESLKAHNERRRLHGVPPLVLNKELSKFATEWAETLAKIDVMKHRPNNDKYGENIYAKWSSSSRYSLTGAEPTNSWYSEIKDFEFGKEPSNLKAGHFTQVIWADSKELGIGVAKTQTGKTYVVANYSPSGNFVGQFAEKVPPPTRKTA